MIGHACKALARWRGPRVVVDRDALTWLIRRAGDAAIYRKELEEMDFFTAIGMPYLRPEERS